MIDFADGATEAVTAWYATVPEFDRSPVGQTVK